MIRRTAARTWRRILSGLRRRRPRLVYSPRYRLAPQVPIDHLRGEKILAFLAAERLIGSRDMARPRRASVRSLRRVHDDAYLQSLQEPAALAAIIGAIPTEADGDAFVDSQRAMTGGTSLCVALALTDGGPVINVGGGLHHAERHRGQGFCTFNDIAVAVSGRRLRGFEQPVLVVDLDLHDGEGTRSIFADDESVFTYSIHNRDLGSPDARASFGLALGDGVDDDTYLAAIRDTLPPIVERVRPGLVIYVAGVDPAWDDAIGDWRISAAGLLERDRLVVETVRSREAVPLAVLLGGGYGPEAWRYTARFASWLIGGRVVEPPLAADLELRRFRRVAGVLSESELTTDPSDSSWSLTEDDLLPTARSRRVLDYYSRHGIELALERYGLLERLRARGHERVELSFELDDPTGHTIRIRTTDDPPASLMELKIRRDRRTLRGYELLSVEWLLLQDPTAEFEPGRPALPGQRHPGLGLLGGVSAILLLACERLDLDGLVIVPTHFHVAAQTRGYFRFLDPEREGRFRALRSALRPHALARQAALLANGRVTEAGSGRVVVWTPAPMVSPVSERLRLLLEEPDYRDRAVRAERTTAYAVADTPP